MYLRWMTRWGLATGRVQYKEILLSLTSETTLSLTVLLAAAFAEVVFIRDLDHCGARVRGGSRSCSVAWGMGRGILRIGHG